MPPFDKFQHILKIGGIPAGVGVAIAVILGFPQEDRRSVEDSITSVPPTYHSFLYDDQTFQGALGIIFGAALVGAVIGVLIAFVLILCGIFPPSSTLGAEELYGRDEDFE